MSRQTRGWGRASEKDFKGSKVPEKAHLGAGQHLNKTEELKRSKLHLLELAL